MDVELIIGALHKDPRSKTEVPQYIEKLKSIAGESGVYQIRS